MIDFDFVQYVALKHRGQTRDEGLPYIIHPMFVAHIVASHGYTDDFISVALGHDLLEDTDAECSDILELTNRDVLEGIIAMTKIDDEPKEEYYERVKANHLAKHVKVADRIHNLLSMKAGGWNKKRMQRYMYVSKKFILPLAYETKMADYFVEVLDHAEIL